MFTPNISEQTTDREDKNGYPSKKNKNNKKKKHKKKNGEPSTASSGSHSNTIYPSDLLKKAESTPHTYDLTSFVPSETQSLKSTCSVRRCSVCWRALLCGWTTSRPPLIGPSAWTEEQTFPTWSTNRSTEKTSLAIFLQQCHFLRHAGHSEKAVRLFQCLLDLTFFKTLSRTYPPDNR
ncbi:unnamed protein product [Oncorhynchus mykiss]|uniref:Uncharacterized protein n=1 Tax=Oncorhynchus mykiss TaxID=8022 RepID=A0A060WBW1_ONCMY|nr:unnamed protein product [Oncorhynchus mykiss]